MCEDRWAGLKDWLALFMIISFLVIFWGAVAALFWWMAT